MRLEGVMSKVSEFVSRLNGRRIASLTKFSRNYPPVSSSYEIRLGSSTRSCMLCTLSAAPNTIALLRGRGALSCLSKLAVDPCSERRQKHPMELEKGVESCQENGLAANFPPFTGPLFPWLSPVGMHHVDRQKYKSFHQVRNSRQCIGWNRALQQPQPLAFPKELRHTLINGTIGCLGALGLHGALGKQREDDMQGSMFMPSARGFEFPRKMLSLPRK